jgi:hypothetical protein
MAARFAYRRVVAGNLPGQPLENISVWPLA